MSWAENIQREFGAKLKEGMVDQILSGTPTIQQTPVATPVVYDDTQHAYTLNQQKYTGASSLAELFHEKFPADAHIRYAEKHGNTPEYWKAKWEEKNLLSRVRGNKIHDANETVDHARMIDFLDGKQMPVIGPGYEDNFPWIERPDGVYTERMVWHHGLRLAGRIDKTILTTDRDLTGTQLRVESSFYKVPKRYAFIKDYKTNERLDFKSYQFANGTYKMMKYPIAHLMDSNWWHYCIQQSVYMICLEYQGFLPGKITIKHYPHPTADDPNPKPVEYEVPYLKKEVLAMCKCR